MVDFDRNVCLVYKVYNRKFSGFGYLCEDLIQEGMLGLWNACQAFDESRGVAFSTYATKCITRAMVDFIRKEMRHKKNQLSIDELIDPERSSDTFEIFAGEDTSKEIMKKLVIEEALNILDKTEAASIVRMKLEGMSQAAIAKKLKISEATVSERLAAAYKQVRDKLGIQEGEVFD